MKKAWAAACAWALASAGLSWAEGPAGCEVAYMEPEPAAAALQLEETGSAVGEAEAASLLARLLEEPEEDPELVAAREAQGRLPGPEQPSMSLTEMIGGLESTLGENASSESSLLIIQGPLVTEVRL